MTAAIRRLEDLGPLYQDYAYGYPHKRAYRPFERPLPLADLWRNEDKSRLFLYVHIPFCEMRCGFCNLFTTVNADADRVAYYVAALNREIVAVGGEIGTFRPVQMAIGGGTPTLLGAVGLEALFSALANRFGALPADIPTGIETSPKTATAETVHVLADHGTDRVSIGIQSFIENETRAMGRPQSPKEARAALDTLRSRHFPRLNIDLIYGAANQTAESLRFSIREALRWRPEEIYLYPLYIRQGTGLDGRAAVADAHRRSLYQAGRDLLREEGYAQSSMRAFSKRLEPTAVTCEFDCQEDGVVGLGAGARSYTAVAHYSTDYAVSRRGVLGILDDYASRDVETFRAAHHGIVMTADERMRRFVLKSILRRDGLDIGRFTTVFGVAPAVAFPVLASLAELRLLEMDDRHIRPTEVGLEYSDAIPALFYSESVRLRMTTGQTT